MPLVDQATAPKRQHWRTTLKRLGACGDARTWCKEQPSIAAAWAACERGDWLLWVAARVITNPVERMLVVLAACDCAETALVHVPTGEERPRKCIETVRAWTRGEATIEQVREGRRAADAAYAAAADAAAYAANAAAYAAAAANAAAAYAANAAAYAAADAADAAAYAANAAAADAADAAYAAAYAADAAADAAAYAAAYAANAAADAARKAHLAKLADIVRARVPLDVVLRAFRAHQVRP